MCESANNLTYLMKGVGLVIDDEINDPKSDICSSIDSLMDDGIWFVKSKDIPKMPTETLMRFSVIILDWKLKDHLLGLDLQNGDALEASHDEDVVNFIIEIIRSTFSPVLVYSNQDAANIETILRSKEELVKALDSSRLSVFHKGGESIKNIITSWIGGHPSVYLPKQMEGELTISQNSLYREFGEISPDWPSQVCGIIKADDSADMDLEFIENLYNCLFDRLDKSKIKLQEKDKPTEHFQPDPSYFSKIMEMMQFEKDEKWPTDVVHSGDIYEKHDTNGASTPAFILNITPECSLRKHKYLFISGTGYNDEGKTKKQKRLEPSICTFSLANILNYFCIQFSFKTFEVVKDLSDMSHIQGNVIGEDGNYCREGRILRNHLRPILDGFAKFMTREGEMRTHYDEAVTSKDNSK